MSRYAAVGVHWADRPDLPEFLAVEGKIVLFDTAEIARQTLPRLGGGRCESWDSRNETVSFSPSMPEGFNQLSIFTGYNPYDVPAGFRARGIFSEAAGRDWRWHVYWRHVLETLVVWSELEPQCTIKR